MQGHKRFLLCIDFKFTGHTVHSQVHDPPKTKAQNRTKKGAKQRERERKQRIKTQHTINSNRNLTN